MLLRKGRGDGYADSNARPLEVGLSTIKVITPRVFILECVSASVCFWKGPNHIKRLMQFRNLRGVRSVM
jgi:hypothetical protein